jgi:hypothetical protein
MRSGKGLKERREVGGGSESAGETSPILSLVLSLSLSPSLPLSLSFDFSFSSFLFLDDGESFCGYFMENGVWVCDEKSAMKIYNGGYFGKGVLSRSEPTFGLENHFMNILSFAQMIFFSEA